MVCEECPPQIMQILESTVLFRAGVVPALEPLLGVTTHEFCFDAKA